MRLQTRAEMRDAVRRGYLNIVPPIDDTVAFPDAQPGDEPEYAPAPSNAVLNQIVGDVVSSLNLDSGSTFLTGLVRIPVAAQTANGALQISLEGDQFTGADAFQVNQIKDAWWEIDDSDSTTRLLTAHEMDTLAREQFRYYSYPPGTPHRYAVDGYSVWLIPAPSEAGTLVLRAGLGVLPPMHDLDTVHQMPYDCANAFLTLVAAEAADSMFDDAGMQAIAARLAPKAQEAKRQILRAMLRMHGKLDGHMTLASYRGRRGR